MGLAVASAPALAADPGANFFRGKTITYVIATDQGGTYDSYGRLIAKYMEQHLPGTRVVVKNVPGAGHIIGTNEIFDAAPDGLTIGTFNTGLVYAQILKRKGIRFDLKAMSYLGKAASEPRVLMVSNNTPYKTFSDLQNARGPIKMATSGVGTASFNETKMLADAFKLNLEVVSGFRGGSGEKDMLKGEVDGQLGSLSSLQRFVEAGNGRILLQAGGKQLRGVPRATEVAKIDDAQAIANPISAQSELGRITAGPPGIPPDRLKALRAAYRSALENPALLVEAKTRKLTVAPLYGDEVKEMVVASLRQSPRTQVILAKIMITDESSLNETVKSKIAKLDESNRLLHLKDGGGRPVTAKLSRSKTRIRLAGVAVERERLKAGMDCEVVYLGPGTVAETVDCK